MVESEIKTLARLAKLDIDAKQFSDEFDEIIAFADAINREIEGDFSTISEVGANQIALENLRADEVQASLENQKILSNVEGENGYFTVKRVVK